MELVRKHFDSIDSTNTWGKQNASMLPEDKITVVTANAQTQGRGRYKRRWESPSGYNLYTSFCFFLPKTRKDLGNIPQILAISLVKFLKQLNFTAKLKWPNDVLINGRKIAGILGEVIDVKGKLCMVLGLGLNVNMPIEYLRRIDRPATSLAVESGKQFNLDQVLEQLCSVFVHDLETFIEKGFTPFYHEYTQYQCVNNAQNLRFHAHGTIWEGILHEINEDGSLSLQLSHGEIKKFTAGEILF